MAHKDVLEPPATERSLRNPRRRNRVESESIKTAPRRKRSKISATTFIPRDSPDDAADDNAQSNGHGHHSVPRRQTSVSIASEIDVAVRGPRHSIKRTPRGDGARVLTQNENYTVKLLASTPKELQDRGVEFRGSISPSTNLALAITREKAYIWDYNSQNGITGARSIELPFQSGPHDPLPFGAFVTNGASNDLGLLLASATTGKLVYHESVDRVTSLGFFQERRDGVEGTVSGLFSGEKIVQLADTAPAGFVALLSSGRAVHVSLRDSQGKPKIHTQVLYTDEQSAGGLFGSIRNILGAGAWKQAVSAVRTRSLERGRVQVLGLMERGELRVWDLDWSGRYEFRASVDFREQLQHELRQMRPAERQGDVDHLALLDMAVLERSHHSNSTELVPVAAGKAMDAIMLVRCGTAGMHAYALVEFTLTGHDFVLARILDVHVGSQETVLPHQARVLVPAPGHTAYVLLPDTITILSLATAASNPEAQLHDASYIEPAPFQDAIYLRPNQGLNFSGGEADASRSTTDASGVIFVDGAGLVRITTHEVEIDSTETSVKSKIEQAVFFGYQENNILDLFRGSRKTPHEDDVEQAVLSVSNDILQSSQRFFDSPPTSVTGNLHKRAQASTRLAAYIQKRHPSLANAVKWQVLTHAEKIAAGIQLWELFEARLNTITKGKRKSTLLNEVCEIIRARYPFDSLWPQNNTSDDTVRTFFTTQLHHLGKLLPWTRRILEDIRNDNERYPADILKLVSEADDIWLHCLDTAWSLRKEKASHYGLQLELSEHAIASELDLRHAPELWTSSDDILKDADKMVDLSRNAVQAAFENDPNALVDGYVKKIAQENSALVELMCRVYLERIAWCRSRGTPKYLSQAQRLEEALDLKRHDEIRQLAEVGQVESGIALAEQYRDMKTLTEVLIAESQYLKESMETAGSSEIAGIQVQVDAIFSKVTDYFDRFGDAFAEAFFGEGFAHGNGGKMLNDAHERWAAPMTRWLRKDPSRAKICWINDVLQDQDYEHAFHSLSLVASDSETNIWNKKVELSLAKLSMNVSFEDNSRYEELGGASMNTNIDYELQVIDVQDRLYQHVVQETYHALDAESAVQNTMEAFFDSLLAFSTWHQLMHQQMAKLLAHQVLGLEELVDLITLADSGKSTFEDTDKDRSETFEALFALSSQYETTEQVGMLRKSCWKRAYLRENWEGLNTHADIESEQEVEEVLMKTNVYRAMYSVLEARAKIPGCALAILLPAETLGVGIDDSHLSSYIPKEFRDSVVEENVIMERQMEAMFREHNVEAWARDILALAKRRVEATSTHDAHDGTNGHVSNGKVNGVKTEENEREASHGLAAFKEDDEMQ